MDWDSERWQRPFTAMAPRGRPAPPGSPPEPLGPRFSNSPPPKTLTPASHPRRPPFSHLASSKGGIHVHTSFQYVRPRPVECNRCEPVAVARWPRRPVCFAPLRPPEPARAPRPRGQRPRRRRLPASGREGRFGQTCSATSLWWDCILGQATVTALGALHRASQHGPARSHPLRDRA